MDPKFIEVLDKSRQNLVTFGGPHFYGKLIKGSLLEKTLRKKYHEGKIHKADKDEFFEKGWYFKKQLKNNRIQIQKNKKIDELLEDEVWLLFKNLGFNEMNKDRQFRIRSGKDEGDMKQIDVFAKDDHHAFVIFCTTKKEENKTERIKHLIYEIHKLRSYISDSIKKHYGKKLRVSFLIITRGIIWSEKEEKLAKEENIFYWRDSEIDEYRYLIEQIGNAAKYQLYSLLFGKKESSEVKEIKVPAMRGGVGKDKYYCFLIQPRKLFKIAYVHRKEKANPKEIGSAYQRMVNKNRIEKIGKFINKGNHFPNNIIINFNKSPTFEPLKKELCEGEIKYGILKFPSYYGCAWVIDGQHRLYGYSKSHHMDDHTLPVIAYESLNVKDQANLFVNINKEQQAVNKNLLWDLYPDIYEGSEDPHQQLLRSISLVARKLNYDKDSVFFGHIQIPSLLTKDKKKTNLTLTTICDVIKETKLLDKDEFLLYNKDYEKTIDFAKEVIKAYFEVISNFLPNDWAKRESGFLRTNVGVRIFFNILRQLLKYLNYQDKKSVYSKIKLTDFKIETNNLLELVKKQLEKMSKDERDSIRAASTKGQVMTNTGRLLWDVKEAIGLGGELWVKGKYRYSPSIPKEEDNEEKIKQLIKDTETKCKAFFIKKLKEIHGEDKWWQEGIPEGTKTTIKIKITQEISRFPPKKKKIDSYSFEKKFKIYSSTSDFKEILKKGSNQKEFSKIFGAMDYSPSKFKDFENLRNAYIGHEEDERIEEIEEIERKLGYWGIKWIRQCIGLEPKKID